MRITPLCLGLATVALAACGSSGHGSEPVGTSSTSSVSGSGQTTAGAVDPNARETLPPGDIPDTVAYVPYHDATLGLTISVPEGWSRTRTNAALTFTDKLNSVHVFTRPAGAPTVSSVRAVELGSIRSSVSAFKLRSITTVRRQAGSAVRITYEGDSQPDAVTGKVGTLAFERYDFFHRGRELIVLLSSPLGSDNVDPWRIITNSLRFG